MTLVVIRTSFNIDIIEFSIFFRFLDGANALEEGLKENGLEYSVHDEYGYLLTCPSGIGTALRAGVHLYIPQLLKV